MTEERLLHRITANPTIFGGKPIVRGMRIPVELILSLLAQGTSFQEILEDYPDLHQEDIQACLATSPVGDPLSRYGQIHPQTKAR